VARPSHIPPPPAPAPNTAFGEYTLIDRLAVGGMAEVFRAREPRTAGEPRVVVLKRMLPQVSAEKTGVAMLLEEARLGARVHHPNVVEFLRTGEVEGQPYLVLEYVPGCDLWRLTRWLLRRGRALGTELAVFIAREVLAGLQAVHEATDDDGEALGIVHQDVSPSNVLLSIYGGVKLGDFGIARARIRQQMPGVSGGGAKGKLGYLAPEQVTGDRTDRRSDVFSCAVVAAELLMGRPLFHGGSELAILLAIRDANIQPFLDLSLPDDLKETIARALAREPSARIGSAATLSELLAPFQSAPESALRAELAGLVQSASGMDPDASERTPEVSAVLEQPPGTPRMDASYEAPATADLPSHQYHVQMGDRIRGPLSFAELVEGITTGDIGADDKVSIDGGPARPVRDQAQLMRHLPMSTLTPITQDARAAAEPDLRRNIAAGGIVRVLAETAMGRDTGLWLCEQGGVRKEVYVKDGVPQFVSSNLAGEMLGEFLVARSVISRGELDMALAVLPRFDGRLGDTLVALGLVEAVHLFQHIEQQVQEKLLELFQWRAGSASFYRGVAPPPSGFPLDLDVWSILEEGIARRLAEGLETQRFSSHLLDEVEQVPQLPLVVQEGDRVELLDSLLATLGAPMLLQDLVETMSLDDDPQRGYRALVLGFALQVVRWKR